MGGTFRWPATPQPSSVQNIAALLGYSGWPYLQFLKGSVGALWRVSEREIAETFESADHNCRDFYRNGPSGSDGPMTCKGKYVRGESNAYVLFEDIKWEAIPPTMATVGAILSL